MSETAKKRLFEILEASSSNDSAGRLFNISIMTLISLNVIAVMLETVQSLSSRYKFLFQIFEIFSVSVFTVEYLLRLWACTCIEKYKNPVTGRIRYALTPMAMVDLLAILPFYLPLLIPFDLRSIRALRLFRLFRMFKMGRYSKALKSLGNVFIERKEEIVIAVFFEIVLLVIASTLIYFVENEAQPEKFSSIPAAMWWGIATLTTVGYGDVYPVTPAGKLLGGIIAFLGISMFALPAGILASGFIEEIKKTHIKRKVCPHCGKDISEL